jgi:uncharacterized delta-60 repeat protein
MKPSLLRNHALLGVALLLATDIHAEYSIDPTFQCSLEPGGVVQAITSSKDGGIFVAGQFEGVNGEARQNLVRVGTNGTLDVAYVAGANAAVKSIRLNGAGELLIGGGFGQVNGSVAGNVARILTGGGVDNTFQASVNYELRSIALSPDGEVIAGGSFTKVNGADGVYVAKFDDLGNPDPDFHTPIQTCMAIETGVDVVAVGVNGKIYVGGNFNCAGRFATLVRLNADGSPDTSFSGDHGPILYPKAIFPLVNGKVLVGGLASPDGIGFVRRLNSDGSVDNGFMEASFDGCVNALVVEDDGSIVAGGSFHRLNDVEAGGIARLSENGSPDSEFGLQVGGVVNALALEANGKILVGGAFNQINNAPAHGVARIENQSFGFHSYGTASPGQFTARLQAEPGKAYVIESSADLRHWSIYTTNTATSAGLEVVDNGAGVEAQRFFRARVQ